MHFRVNNICSLSGNFYFGPVDFLIKTGCSKFHQHCPNLPDIAMKHPGSTMNKKTRLLIKNSYDTLLYTWCPPKADIYFVQFHFFCILQLFYLFIFYLIYFFLACFPQLFYFYYFHFIISLKACFSVHLFPFFKFQFQFGKKLNENT